MSLLLIILLILLVCGVFGGIALPEYRGGGIGVVGLILIVLIILFATGNL